jgi:hypothetical protein
LTLFSPNSLTLHSFTSKSKSHMSHRNSHESAEPLSSDHQGKAWNRNDEEGTSSFFPSFSYSLMLRNFVAMPESHHSAPAPATSKRRQRLTHWHWQLKSRLSTLQRLLPQILAASLFLAIILGVVLTGVFYTDFITKTEDQDQSSFSSSFFFRSTL